MNKLVKSLLVAAAFSLSAGASSAYAQDEAKSLDQLLELVKENRAASQRINAQREAEFTSARADKQALLNSHLLTKNKSCKTLLVLWVKSLVLHVVQQAKLSVVSQPLS